MMINSGNNGMCVVLSSGAVESIKTSIGAAPVFGVLARAFGALSIGVRAQLELIGETALSLRRGFLLLWLPYLAIAALLSLCHFERSFQ